MKLENAVDFFVFSFFSAIRAASGAWFYTGNDTEQTKVKKKKVYGSFLMKKVKESILIVFEAQIEIN